MADDYWKCVSTQRISSCETITTYEHSLPQGILLLVVYVRDGYTYHTNHTVTFIPYEIPRERF